MKKLLLLLLVLGGIDRLRAQSNELETFEFERINLDKNAMLVLGGWSVVNIVTGAVGTNSDNRQRKYFHQMNLVWNASNLLIAGLGYYGASSEKVSNLTLEKVLSHQNKKEKIFLFNAGLDLAYITGGFYLTERSRRNADPSKLKGFGNSVIMQGGFLLVFDAVMYTLHRQHGKKLSAILAKLSFNGGPGGFALAYRL
jgi:hypothetical protein